MVLPRLRGLCSRGVRGRGLKQSLQVDRPCRLFASFPGWGCAALGDWSLPSNHAAIAGALTVVTVAAWRSAHRVAAAVVLTLVGRRGRGSWLAHFPHDVGPVPCSVASWRLWSSFVFDWSRLGLPSSACGRKNELRCSSALPHRAAVGRVGDRPRDARPQLRDAGRGGTVGDRLPAHVRRGRRVVVSRCWRRRAGRAAGVAGRWGRRQYRVATGPSFPRPRRWSCCSATGGLTRDRRVHRNRGPVALRGLRALDARTRRTRQAAGGSLVGVTRPGRPRTTPAGANGIGSPPGSIFVGHDLAQAALSPRRTRTRHRPARAGPARGRARPPTGQHRGRTPGRGGDRHRRHPDGHPHGAELDDLVTDLRADGSDVAWSP
ncbi:hypothetical protein HBB16_02550 [Pseudonocardia sp. MCCB 268]|nr:hypothetical protein [Pseudonocardia cytotoxica]